MTGRERPADDGLRLDRIRRGLSPGARATLRGALDGALQPAAVTYRVAEELWQAGLVPNLSTMRLTPEGAEVAKLEKEAADGR